MTDNYFGSDSDDSIDQSTLQLPYYGRIYSGAGNDHITVSYSFVQGDVGNDIITDLTGDSIVDYYSSPTGIQVNLKASTAADGYGTVDTLINVHNIQGSFFGDEIIGSDSADTFMLYKGNDFVDGGVGTDELIVFNAIENYDIQYLGDKITLSNRDADATDAGLKTLVNVENIRFAGGSVPVRELFPEISSSPYYQFKRNAIPDLYNYYHWEGWSPASVALSLVSTADLNHDGKADIFVQLWQRVPEGNMPTEMPTPNRLIILESQSDGSYKDTTAARFNTNSAVVLGGELGGVGLADTGDINKDGLTDFIFGLNRDDGRAGTLTSGNSYPTAIMSKADGTYEIQKISSSVWNYFTQLVNVDGNYEAWFSQIGYYSSSVTYGSSPTGWVEGLPVYQYDAATKEWTVSGQPPISTSFNVLPEFIKDGKVSRVFTMLIDSSNAIDPLANVPGGAYQVPYSALMDVDANGQWHVTSTSKPFNYTPTQFKMGNQTMTGQVGFDGEIYFSLVEYFFRPGSFEIFPNSGQVVMATRSMLPLEKDSVTGAYKYTGSDVVKLDFYGIEQDHIAKLPIKIIGMQETVYSWAYSYLDINNDGLIDIAQQGWDHLTQTGGGPSVYLNTGAGVFVHLDSSIFPKAPDYWNKPAMSAFLDANGDGIYDLLYFPAYAEAQYISDTNWELFEATSVLSNEAYKDNITISDRIGSPLIFTWSGDDLVLDVNAAKGISSIDMGSGNDVVQYSILRSQAQLLLRTDSSLEVLIAGQDRTDVLRNVEVLRFTDQDVAIDLSAPKVLTLMPVDEATGVVIGSNIVVTFSEAIQRGTGSIVLKDAANNVVATYDAATSSNVSIFGDTLTLNPTADLNHSIGYKLEFSPGAVKDLAGNSFEGSTSYNFTTTSALNESEVQKLYIAYFNRPGDPGGLGYWEGLLANDISMAMLQNSFSSSAEYQAIYIGQQNTVLITKLYQNLFGRVVDVNDGGVQWWAGEMVAGRHTITTIAGALSSGTTPGSADNIAIINKIAAATAFTNALNTTAETENYVGAAAFAIAGNWLAPIRDANMLATALASRDDTIAAAVAAKTVLVNTMGTADASQDVVTFELAAASFDFTISGFGLGDRIDFATGATPTLTNASYSDGQVNLTWSAGGNNVVIQLVGLSGVQDSQLNSLADFDTVFGVSSVY